ncbi:MAG: YARHG domain-containing protein [Chitinispirillia bacterium]|nr:YARHG domain-containing protein [Chitinispirillia bacterium]MCL2242427.1 YARHG domain-containing protein [Chitinispirillia bacterium]
MGDGASSQPDYLFGQNFAGKDVPLVYDDYDYAGLNVYMPNTGFSAGRIIIYNGSVNLLDEKIPETALAVLDKKELRLLRNAIFAKHGMIFQSDDLKAHFGQFSWYNPKSDNVNNQLTDIDKANVQRILAFENAKPNTRLSRKDLIHYYSNIVPAPSWCASLSINEDNTINYDGGGEDKFKGSYKIENGFLVVLVTEQHVSAEEPRHKEYFLDKSWRWPGGVTYKDGTVTYREPVKMVFPLGEPPRTTADFPYIGRKIGSIVWWTSSGN